MTDEEQSIVEMWRTVERMVTQMGYKNLRFSWDGPLYKPEHHYLGTHYPLGTTCWYVMLECDGLRDAICADTPQEAVRQAAAIMDGGGGEVLHERIQRRARGI